MKFRLKVGKGAVHDFTDAAGITYKPGAVVDLPSCYEGEAWLERVDPVPVVVAVPGKIEPVAVEALVPVPLEAPKTVKKRVPKKLKS